MAKKVLIVDDSIYMRSLIKTALEEQGYEIVGEAANGETAIDLAMELQPDLITLDNILPDMMGFEILKVLKGEGLDSKVIIAHSQDDRSGSVQYSACLSFLFFSFATHPTNRHHCHVDQNH